MRTAAACIGVMLSTAVILAQQAEFRSGTELVTIDVVATDADGRPVKNLVAADFEIFEDDAAQTIQAFQFIDTTSVASTPALPAGVSGNQQEPGALFAEKQREDWLRDIHRLEVVRWVPAEMRSRNGRAEVAARFARAAARAS